jgi:hypothetical protein
MPEPEDLVLALLRDMRTDITDIRSEMATKSDIGRLDTKIDDLRSDVKSLAADVASDMLLLEKRLGNQISSLRRSVMEYHSSAVGHGVLLSEFEERLRKVEQRLDIAPPETY